MWTSDRVLDFVLGVEREMDKLADLQFRPQGKSLPLEEACGKPSSAVIPRLKAMFGDKARTCYADTYLRCSSEWAITVPFTLSKVTIVEQTPSKVVADVVEASIEDIRDGVAIEGDGDGGRRPLTEQEVSGYKDTSRYTITRGKDGVWRISDRKPPFKWDCQQYD